jgi:hypothetical protein
LEGELFLEQDPIWMEDPEEWMSAGMLEEIQLTRENFTDYFYYNGGSRPGSWIEYDSNPFTNNGATRYRRNNWKAWRTIVDSRMFYILQQRNGEIYLAYGYYDSEGEVDPYSDDSEFYLLKRMTQRTPEELKGWGIMLIDEYGRENIQPWSPEKELHQALEQQHPDGN